MKTTVNRVNLLQAVKNACLIVPGKKDSPIIQNVLINVDDDCQVVATDFNQIYKEKIKSDTIEPGLVLVNAKKLLAILNKSKADRVTFNDNKTGFLSLQLDRMKVKLPCFEGMLFPSCDINLTKPMFFLEPTTVKTIFDKTYTFIGDNESRKMLMGLNIKKERDYIRFIGADAFRIADYRIWNGDIPDSDYNIIFPKYGLRNISKLFLNEAMLFQTDGITLQVTTNDQQYQCKLIDADYPDLDTLLRAKTKLAKIETDSLIESAEMMQVLTEKNKNTAMKCTFNGNLTLESQTADFGDGSVSVDCDFDNDEASMGLNIHFFNEISKIFKKEAQVEMSFNDHESPFIFKSPSIENYQAALMPVRIQW